jgi:hypothetical protein
MVEVIVFSTMVLENTVCRDVAVDVEVRVSVCEPLLPAR